MQICFVSAHIEHLIKQIVKRDFIRGALQFPYHGAKGFEFRRCTGYRGIIFRIFKYLKKGYSEHIRNIRGIGNCGISYPPFRAVDNSSESYIIIRIIDNIQICYNILDFHSFIEFHTAYNLIGYSGTDKNIFKRIGLGIHSV